MSSKSKKHPRTISASELEELYKRYPRKKGKTRGIQRLSKLPLHELPRLHQALDNFLEELDQKDTVEMNYIPHFSTWANRWEDDLEKQDKFYKSKNNQFDSWIDEIEKRK